MKHRRATPKHTHDNKENSMTAQPEKLDLNSLNISAEKRQQLLDLFPEARTENGKIDFERLKLALGETVEGGKERYGMNWPGKADCYKAIQTPSQGTLLPCPAESVNFDSTENLIIEGDNLEVLKLLQKSYLGKIKMIYIDPPYNTGNDFVYPDDFSDSLRNYQEYTGQVDAEGRKFGTNSDSDGRFHSRWMNMMYPRLYLARNLLREDGVIFISIDDNEVTNLRKICDEIFGEENFVELIIWKKRSTPPNDKVIGANHDYILIFSKNIDQIKLNLRSRNEEQLARYQNPDNHPKGPWTPGDLMANVKGGRYVPSLYFSIKNPLTGEEHYPGKNGNWRFNKTTIENLIENNEIYFGENGKGRPKLKRFLSDVKKGITWPSIWDFVPLNTQGSQEMIDFFGDMTIFENPKPSGLILELLKLGSQNDSLILDFFAGSGTTGHATLELNKEDGGNRKFILVQLPEPTGREDYPTIAEITKERVRRVIKKLNDSEAGQLPLDAPQDRGFRVFKLDASNFKPWDANAPQNAQSLARQLELHIDHVLPGRSQPDIFYEILLKSGFALTTPLETLTLAGKQVFSIAGSKLLVCLEPELTLEVIRAMAALKPERVVCLDASFTGNDQLKANAVQIFRTQGDPSFKTV
jgi:adenine-specific DNA-methyltransferase